MKKSSFLLVLPLIAGCLSSSVPEPSDWMVSYNASSAPAAKADFDVARISQVLVRAPFDGRRLAVLRADGTVAFDAYNQFAALPSQLLKAPLAEALAASGRFQAVVAGSSAASTGVSVEAVVTRWALDCRAEGKRLASVQLTVQLQDRARTLLHQVRGEATVDAADGNFGQAFSEAFSKAVDQAVRQF